DEVIAMAAGNYDADRPYKIISKQGVRELPVADKDPAVPERLWTFWRMASDNQGGRDLVMDLRYRGHDMNWLLKQ
ncbi:MAG: hypothetical protein KKD39_04625, partial [Candidatus Altiarchaeota archaeon]|nr:hypothetical protein [Candidatus Altiarchaeota archaeon]